MAFEEVNVDLWKPLNAGDTIEGVFIGVDRDVGANNSNLYTLNVNDKPVGVWGSTVLDPKMSAVIPGDLIKIQFDGLGKAKGGHSAPKLFKVFIDFDKRNEKIHANQ